MLLGITGTNASGKSTLVDYLKAKGYASFSLSDELRVIVKEKGLEPTRDVMIEQGEIARKENGHGYLAQRVMQKVSGSAVIDSIRHPAEAQVIKAAGGLLIAIDAPIEERFERARKRGRTGDGETLDDFKEKEQREMNESGPGQQLSKTMQLADILIQTDDNPQNLFKKVDAFLEKHDTQ